MASREKVGVVIGMLCEAFNRKPSVPMVEAYFAALSDLEDAAIDGAGLATLRSPDAKFMPTPGELRALAVTGGRGTDAQSDAAWLAFCNAVSSHGAYRSVNFRDGLINATVRLLGGWERVCLLPVEEFEKWLKKDFVATYKRLLASGCSTEITGYLIGQGERENAGWVGQEYGKGSNRYQISAPVDIGADYEPLLLSPPAANQISKRPDNIPTIEFKKAN